MRSRSSSPRCCTWPVAAAMSRTMSRDWWALCSLKVRGKSVWVGISFDGLSHPLSFHLRAFDGFTSGSRAKPQNELCFFSPCRRTAIDGVTRKRVFRA